MMTPNDSNDPDPTPMSIKNFHMTNSPMTRYLEN